jgi:hypothetical protein
MEGEPGKQSPRRSPSRSTQLHPIALQSELSQEAHPKHPEPSLTVAATGDEAVTVQSR